jgi:hypothetical protein
MDNVFDRQFWFWFGVIVPLVLLVRWLEKRRQRKQAELDDFRRRYLRRGK